MTAIEQVRKWFADRGPCLWDRPAAGSVPFSLECYAVNGVVFIVQVWENGGCEIYAPVHPGLRLDDNLAAMERMIAKPTAISVVDPNETKHWMEAHRTNCRCPELAGKRIHWSFTALTKAEATIEIAQDFINEGSMTMVDARDQHIYWAPCLAEFS